MRKIIKWGARFVLFILLASFLAGIAGYTVLLNTVPDDNQKITGSDVSQSVSVVFDENAVPHIEAETLEDAYFALGYIHASERLWQMEFLRRVGQGRLSEFLGEATVDTDMFLRTLDMANAAEKSFEVLGPKTQMALGAYAKGVNSFIDRETSLLEPSLPVEFLILGHTPEQWKAWNSILILKVMGLNLGSNMSPEIRRMALASKGFSPREIEDVMPYGPRDVAPPLPDLHKLYGYENKETASLQQSKALDMLVQTEGTASNNWVVAGERTQSGKPVLANDPHLGFTAPAVFYLAHMSFKHEGKQHDLIGGGIPGTPFILSGRSNRMAWGLTNTGLDSQDLFIEKINPENENQYKTEFGWAKFETQEVTIDIKGGGKKIFTRALTRHGPVLPSGFQNLKDYLPNGHVAALSWTGLANDDTTVEALLNASLSDTVDEYTQALNKAVSPMQSVVMADVDGNIGLATPGRIPLRKSENIINGRAPVLGWIPKYQWAGFASSADVPKTMNPSQGALATANAKFFKPDFPYHITYDWASPYRQSRAEKLVIETDDIHSIDQSKEIMADDKSEALMKFIQLAHNYIKSGTGKTGDVLHALQVWDGRMQMDKAEPIIALAWFRHFHEGLLKDDLGENIYALFNRGRIDPIIHILEQGTSRQWCQNSSASELFECGELLISSLEKALDELGKLQGDNWQNWNYGDAHTLYAEHNPFSKVPPLASFFTVEVPSGGGPYTLHRGQTNFGKEGPYRNRHGAAYRGIYDLGNPDASLFIQSTGQSGNVMSPHYRDFADKWAGSIFIPMTTNRDEYSRNAKGIWSFTK